jgi:membrane dipeptidase
MTPALPRLVDLGIAWLDQYRRDLGLDGPDPPIGRLDGYLGATRLAWLRVAEAEHLTRLEAEFCGRLLLGPDDWRRFETEPEDGSLTWGVPVAQGAPLGALLDRGVRVWRVGDVSELEAIEALRVERRVPCVGVDLGALDAAALAASLDWLEAGSRRVEPLFVGSTAEVSLSSLERLRSLGATFGLELAAYASVDALAEAIEALAALPSPGAHPFAGLGLATAYLNPRSVAPELVPAERLVGWVMTRFGPEAGEWLVRRSGLEWIRAVTT